MRMAVKNTKLAGGLLDMNLGLENIHILKIIAIGMSELKGFLIFMLHSLSSVVLFYGHLLPYKLPLTQMVRFDCPFSQLFLLRNQHPILHLMLKISAVFRNLLT